MARKKKAQKPVNVAMPTIVVDNPAYQAGHPGSIQRITVERALRDDPLGQMHARNQITEHQYAAGRKWQAAFETAGIGRIKAMDTTQEPVDGGGRFSDPMTDRRLRAFNDLKRWNGALGKAGAQLVNHVLCDKRSLREVGQLVYASTSPATMKYVGRRFRECLDQLATEMGLA